MLVSTHNLGSVPRFCDRVVLVKGTVLAYGPTETTFTRANLARAFGGQLREVSLGGPDLHHDDHADDRRLTIADAVPGIAPGSRAGASTWHRRPESGSHVARDVSQSGPMCAIVVRRLGSLG